jgi:hypothetical protein
MAMFNSYVNVYQRVSTIPSMTTGVMGGPQKGHACGAAQDDDESSNLSLGTTIEAGKMW